MSNLLKEANFPEGWVAKKRKKGEEDLPIELIPQSLHIGLWVKALKTLGQKLVIVFEKKIPKNWIKGVEKFEKILRPKKAFCLKKFLYVNAKTDRK